MKPFLEAPLALSTQASLVAFERRENVFSWNWHYHREIELTLIGKGHGTRLVGDHSDDYGPHDLVLLGSNLPHTWFSSTGKRPSPNGHQAIVIQFQPQTFPADLLALPEFASLEKLFARAARGLHFSKAAGRKVEVRLRALLQKKGIQQWLDLASILNDLASFPGTVLASAGYQHRRSFKLSSRLERVINHVERHYQDKASLAQTAKIVGLTPSAFSRFFRKMTHQTFVSYRNGCRIREACSLLTETDLSITEIAYECGFCNLANFNRRFREIQKMVPREYRRLHNPDPANR